MAPVTYAFQNIKSTKKLRNFSKLTNYGFRELANKLAFFWYKLKSTMIDNKPIIQAKYTSIPFFARTPII